MSKEHRGLGRGLGALLGEMPDADRLRQPVGYVNKEIVGTRGRQENTADILRIPVDMIEPNPFQPRMSFDQAALEELASSIRTLGLIQPITVRRITDRRYQIISGERRYKACRMARSPIAGTWTVPSSAALTRNCVTRSNGSPGPTPSAARLSSTRSWIKMPVTRSAIRITGRITKETIEMAKGMKRR